MKMTIELPDSAKIIRTEDTTTTTAMRMADLPQKVMEYAEDMKNHHIITCR